MLRETCDAIFSVLKHPDLKPPSSKDDLENIEKVFRDFWNMPHVVAAIDGKHMRIQCPKKTTQYHNYKGFFSLVLLAICDARYCFTLFDVGQYGGNNKNRIQNGQMNLPEAEYLEGCNFDPLPYFLIGDEISLLRTWLMRPIPGKLSLAEQILNYRLSKARRVIENTFGCKMRIIQSSYHCVS